MKKICLYSIILCFAISCKENAKNAIDNDFTFIKIDYPEKNPDSLKGIFGASIFIQSIFKEDSLIIIKRQPDDIDAIYNSKPLVYKLKMPDSLKIAFKKFYNYAVKLKNGTLPNHNYEKPLIYSGGQYIITFKDSSNNEHYYGYIHQDLSIETQTFHDLLFYLWLDLSSKNNLKVLSYINSDSITTALCKKEGMENILPLVPIVEEPPIKY